MRRAYLPSRQWRSNEQSVKTGGKTFFLESIKTAPGGSVRTVPMFPGMFRVKGSIGTFPMIWNVLPEEYYAGDTVQVARSLLGKVMVHLSPEGCTSGIIVETEAYLSKDDPACHAARGKTKRNAAMFGPPGRAYVYFIYGNYYCFNVVTNIEGVGEAVLVRALQPLEGLELMQKRRGKLLKPASLANGPGKLCIAMGITWEHNAISLQGPPLFITKGFKIDASLIGSSGRIGIKLGQDKPWRFFIKGNSFLSRREV